MQEKVRDLIEPVINALGCELWGVEYLSQGRQATLRIYIEKEAKDGGVNSSGVALEDCEKVSRQVSSILDVEDPIAGHYRLEVSSPGMDRPLYCLAHFQRYIGEKVAVKLYQAFDGRRKMTGKLAAVEGDEVVLQVEGEEYLLPIETIEKARIVPVF